MTWASVAHTGAGSSDGDNVSTTGINTTDAGLIVVNVPCLFTGGEVSLADSFANPGWVRRTTYGSASGGKIVAFYCISPNVGAGHVFNVTSTGGKPTALVQAFKNTLQPGIIFNNQETGLNVTAPATTAKPGSLASPSSAYLHVFGAMFDDGNNARTLSLDVAAVLDQITFASGTHEGGGMAFFPNGFGGAVDPEWTISAAGGILVGAFNHLVFKASTGALKPLQSQACL